MSVIVDLAIEFLRCDPSGKQRFTWSANAEEALTKMLDFLFAYPSQVRSGIDDLLRLVCALELELSSPMAADRLRTILKTDPRVVEVCDVTARSEELRAAQTRWSGGETSKEAPVYGRPAPKGTITAASLVDPISRRRLERPHHHLNRVAVAKRPAIAGPRDRRS